MNCTNDMANEHLQDAIPLCHACYNSQEHNDQLYNFIHRFIHMYDCECEQFMYPDDKGNWQKCLHCEAKNIAATVDAQQYKNDLLADLPL